MKGFVEISHKHQRPSFEKMNQHPKRTPIHFRWPILPARSDTASRGSLETSLTRLQSSLRSPASGKLLPHTLGQRILLISLFITCCGAVKLVCAQDTLTGAFEGVVSNSQTGMPIAGASVEIISPKTRLVIRLISDNRGRFYQGLLAPGPYTIRVSMTDFETREISQRLRITYTGEVVPVPVSLDPAQSLPAPSASALPTPAPPVVAEEDVDIRAQINRNDGRQSGSFTDDQVTQLPLGGTTLARTFDELALLLPGVAPPPQTLGNGAGPGVGAGVGSAGQFAVNGLRSRDNNFTVDGSDNNDEDIGVRRQGFVALIPQPIESIQEYQVITLLAPAQFGRNIGGQVNAVSKSGGSKTHGTFYGSFNSSQLNARNFFDTANDSNETSLTTDSNQPVLLNGSPILVRNQSGGEDSLTFVDAGFVLGGPLASGRMFYFISAEEQVVNATREESFAVPTIEQRGPFRNGATGIYADPFSGLPTFSIPNNRGGSAVFNLFPFPNNPTGVYGTNTFTQVLPARERGAIFSGKFDGNFRVRGRAQSATARYNFTNDWRQIPTTGGALFSTLKPRVRTQNFSSFLNSELSRANSPRPLFNQLRLSYGRTRLAFDEVRDQEFQFPSSAFPTTPFLLNAPLMFNVTQPAAPGVPNTGPVSFISPIALPRIGRDPLVSATVEQELGPLGQVDIAGFSPIGVDVFNFPQRRVNNTYQAADELTWRRGNHNLAFGIDVRRSELNSDLPRNARTRLTFSGAPRLIFENGSFRLPTSNDLNSAVRPEDLAALGAASNAFLTLNTSGTDANVGLRFYQFNFYGQDTWHIRRSFSLSFGLRYEYNTPVKEVNERIENTFSDPALNLAPGLRPFIGGRTQIYDSDRNNLAPRIGLAYSPRLLSRDRVTVLRAGYGMFYDQIPGAVVSQSRNVYPTFLTLNFGGLVASSTPVGLTIVNPGRTFLTNAQNQLVPIVLPGTINSLNPAISLSALFGFLNIAFPGALGATLPSRQLEMPLAHHYSFSFEQQLQTHLVVSLSYVGTQGRHLLRFTTPNLGPSSTVAPTSLRPFVLTTVQGPFSVPEVLGVVRSPQRPVTGIGAINRFETSARSHYDSLQFQVRARLQKSLQFQAAYTLSNTRDDVSDVFDLAGAFVLPQDSLTFAGESGPANFDVRHRLAYYLIYDFPARRSRGIGRLITNGLQIASTGRFRTGQPFTVNSIFDVNLDGNLTDRLNTTAGLISTGDRRQPLILTTNNPLSLLAPFGQDGQVGRNTFRAGNCLELDASVLKRWMLANTQSLVLRVDIFNFINRANFGIPVRFLEAPAFGQATSTITPGRRVQFSLKYSF